MYPLIRRLALVSKDKKITSTSNITTSKIAPNMSTAIKLPLKPILLHHKFYRLVYTATCLVGFGSVWSFFLPTPASKSTIIASLFASLKGWGAHVLEKTVCKVGRIRDICCVFFVLFAGPTDT